MNPIIRNSLGLFLGVVIGGSVNMGIINISGSIIPPPDGADVTTMEGLKASIHLFQPKHFIMPFLAHALGTFAGALVAALIAVSHKMKVALAIGIVFLAGGIGAVSMLPAPAWFNITDLVLAYIPMGFIAGYIANKTAIR